MRIRVSCLKTISKMTNLINDGGIIKRVKGSFNCLIACVEQKTSHELQTICRNLEIVVLQEVL